MFWKKKSKTGPAPKSRKQKAIRSYKKEGGHIKSSGKTGRPYYQRQFRRHGSQGTAVAHGTDRRPGDFFAAQCFQAGRTACRIFEGRSGPVPGICRANFQDKRRTRLQFLPSSLPRACRSLMKIHWNDWIGRILHAHQDKGMNGAVRTMQDVDSFVRSFTQSPGSVRLEKVSRILESFVTGLSGRKLEIQSGETFYTDTRVIRLPEVLAEFDNYDNNFALYKSMVVHSMGPVLVRDMEAEYRRLPQVLQGPCPGACTLSQAGNHPAGCVYRA